MSNGSYSWGSISTNGGIGVSLTPSEGQRPEKTPAGLIVTRAVETKKGWVGQVLVDKEIVRETEPFPAGFTELDSREAALREVNAHVVSKFRSLFS